MYEKKRIFIGTKPNRPMKKSLLSPLLLLCVLLLAGCTGRPYSLRGDSVTVRIEDPAPGAASVLRLQFASPELVRVSASPDGRMHDRASLVVVPQKKFRDYRVSLQEGVVCVQTGALTVLVDPKDGALRFLDAAGEELLGGSRMGFEPTEVEGKAAFSTRVSFDSPEDEAFYGLGQHQSGELNHKGRSEELFQYNTKVSLPMVVSTRGYGLLFDAYSYSRWGNPEGFKPLGEIFKLYDKNGVEGALTGTYKTRDGKTLVRREENLYFENERAIRNLPDIPLSGAKVVYEGWIEPRETGEHYFTQYYAGFQQTEINGEEVMSRRWRPAWNPNSYRYSMSLFEGLRYPVRIEWEPDGDVSYLGLRCAPVQSDEMQIKLCFSSEFEPMLDFYFIAGGSYDGTIRGYRQLTGAAPLIPKWALGFWQSRER